MNLTIINFPAINGPATTDLRLVRNDARFRSPLSGIVQDILRPGAYWAVTLTWHVLSGGDDSLLQAWAIQMAKAGYRSPIVVNPYARQGTGNGTPVVDGAGQTGNSLITSGWAASAANVLLPGDLISWSSAVSGQHQTCMVVETPAVNASGIATIYLEPALRFSPDNAGAINISNTQSIYCMFEKPSYSVSFTPPRVGSMSLSLVEDITA